MTSSRTNRKRSQSSARRVVDVVSVVVTVVAAYFLWPASLGGSSRIILVHGHSMEPTYVTGDLVVLNTDATPQIGEIIVFQIPKDEPGGGQLVVHRLIGRREDGTYVTQGDNAPNVDAFRTSRSDILGSPRFSIPHGGRAIGMFGSPIGLGAVVGMACTVWLWPRKRDPEQVDDIATAPDETVSLAAAVAVAVDVAAEAEAWLREQLDLLAASSRSG